MRPMKRSTVTVIVLAALALAGEGCMFLTRFDPEEQLCDARAPADQQCLPGYACAADGKCKKSSTPFDAGSSDAGP